MTRSYTVTVHPHVPRASGLKSEASRDRSLRRRPPAGSLHLSDRLCVVSGSRAVHDAAKLPKRVRSDVVLHVRIKPNGLPLLVTRRPGIEPIWTPKRRTAARHDHGRGKDGRSKS